MTEVEETVGLTVDGQPVPESRHCPRCSAAVEPLQEYCLECGLRLPRAEPGVLERSSAELAGRHPWTGGWLLSALLGLAIAAVGTAAAIAISDGGDSSAAVTAATGGSRTATTPTPTLTAPEPTAPATTAPPPATTAPPTTTAPRPPATIAWPADKRGWTIVLLSVPQGNGRPAAEEQAAAARRKGLTDVGVLNSSRFASLHPGYFAVFTGIFDSEAEATSALPRARSAFPLAYSRPVVP